MSTPDNGADTGPTGKGGVKTLAIRLEPALHAQLSLIAQLRASTITDEIRTAIEAHIARPRRPPELAAQSQAVLDDIDREASARRDAIATLFGTAEASRHGRADDDPARTYPQGRRDGGDQLTLTRLATHSGANPGRGSGLKRTARLTARPCQQHQLC